MKIFLASAGVPARYSPIPFWRKLATEDRGQRHHVVDEPDAADIVLFTECNHLGSDWRLTAIRESPITREFREKVYVYDQRDRPWCAFPGAYVSMPASRFDARYQVASSYIPAPGAPIAVIGEHRRAEPDLLVSLVGSPTHPVRRKLFDLRHPRGVFEEVDGFLFSDSDSKDFIARREHFDEVLVRSKFVLCPRGHGTSSFRLYETLAAGRVPVIVSDDWVPPIGPDWDAISLQWREHEPAHRLLEHLEQIEPRAEEMGRRAFEAFGEWFAPSVMFDRVATRLQTLADDRAALGFPARGIRGRAYRRLVAAHAVGQLRSRLEDRRAPR